MVVDHVLKVGREMDLARANAGKRVEGVGWKRRRAVLDSARQTVLLARYA